VSGARSGQAGEESGRCAGSHRECGERIAMRRVGAVIACLMPALFAAGCSNIHPLYGEFGRLLDGRGRIGVGGHS
jgi:hypothetical protein